MLEHNVMTAASSGLTFYYNRRAPGCMLEHQHDAHQITLTISGQPKVCWRSATRSEACFTAAEGNLIVTPAHESHRIHWDSAWESMGFYVARSVTETVARAMGLGRRAEVISSFSECDPAIYGLARSVQQGIGNDTLSCRLYAESVANVLAARLLVEHSRERRAPTYTAAALSAAAMHRVECFILENLERNISVSDIAAVLDLSAYHFSRRFRARAGMSPYQYVTRQRIERARGLLGDPRLAIAEIADRAGFSSQSHFNKQFRALVGTTPRCYREGL
ncbi:MAG: helix-turn-helix transcriptional regulator [Proteobacteria bacterium]|nr:helix-turn-helix transcriptional regulator [Burkholderiales bacterium]